MIVSSTGFRSSSFGIPTPFRNMKLRTRFALMGAISVLLTATALVFLAVWQSSRYNNLAQAEVDTLINADLEHITRGVYNLVMTEDEAVQSHVDANLNVARHVLEAVGKVSLSKENVPWKTTNQFTGKSDTINLPKLLIGNIWPGQNTDLSIETPVVDEVTRLVEETATIFQRMNDHGDMLRVATTVKDSAGNRAIGTYIPAVNPDGSANPVVSSILNGQTYHGRAYVVNAWYLTAYEPLRDSNGDLVGMLYVGVRQKAVESRVRNAILQTRVGKTGYVYVLGGKDKDRGRYIISYKGLRDGEEIWSSRDSDGRYAIQEIIQKALTLGPGEMTTLRYRWQNTGESSPRWKVALLAYYAPWDWVIGTGVYEDELQNYRTVLDDGRIRMVRDMASAGIAITIMMGLIGILLAFKITRPIHEITRVAEKIIDGDLNQIVTVTSQDDIGTLARTFNLMTEQLKRTMQDLKNNEEKYRLIFENAMEGLFVSTLDGRFVSANPAMASIIGYESPEALILNITDLGKQVFVDPKVREKMIAILLEHGKISGFEALGLRKDRTQTWVSISARLRYDPAGNPAFIEGFAINITDRKRAEEALAESRNFLNEIINTIADPLFVKDQRHRWVLVNDAFCTSVGHTRKELLGKNEYDFFEKSEVDVYRRNDELVLTTGEQNINEEVFTGPDKTSHLMVTKKTLYQDQKNQKYIVGIIRDITQQKQAEEEKKQLEVRLTQAQKMEAIGTLAGGIAHDFNNILSAIIGNAELAEDNVEDVGNVQKHLGEVLKASDRARDLVKQILTFSRMTKTEFAPIALRSVVKESLKMLRSVIPSTVEIRQNLVSSGLVMSDPTQIHQIVMNLCTNAVHAMDETGGVIEVTLHEETIATSTLFDGFQVVPGPFLKLTIRDNGIGIPPEILKKIFEPYFTTKEQGRGTGLGLSVIHGIIVSHKGAITCRSILNKGTTFDVYLPMIKSEYSGTMTYPSIKAPIPTGNERILIVDDEKILADMSAEMLSNRGYKVVSMTNSLDALERFRKNPGQFDLVISDMTMPGMTGDRLARELIALREDIPFIICTGYSEHISEARAKEIGIKALIHKPLDIRSLSETVRRVLDESAGD